MNYTSRHIRELFSISHQTVKNYADEFSDHLSVTGAPGKGRTRLFTADDLTVFALVKELKDRGMTYADIHTALAAGERGIVPDSAGALVETAPSGSIVALQQRVVDLEQQLVELRTERDMTAGELIRANAEIDALKAEVRALYRQLPRE